MLCLAGLGWASADAIGAEPTSQTELERSAYVLLERERAAEAWPQFDRLIEQHGEGAGSEKLDEWLNASAYARALGSNDPREWRAGLELVERSLRSEEDNANRLDTKGWLLCRLGEVEKGSQVLRRAADLAGDDASPDIAEHLEGCRVE